MANVAMVVTNRYEPDPRVQKEAASLVAGGHRVRVYCFDRMSEAPQAREVLDGVEIIRLQLGHYAYGQPVATALGLRKFRRAVRQALLRDPPDVLHCHDQDTCSLGAAWQGRRLPNGRRAKFVFDAHDFYWTYPLYIDNPARWRHVLSGVLKAQGFHYVRKADLLITVTEGIGKHPGYAELYRSWGVEPVVLWNAPRAVAQIPPLPAQFTLGYYGYVRDTEMFRWLIAAIEQLPPQERPAVRVAGAGVAHAQVERLLREASTRLGFPARVSGAFDMRELGSLMGECSAQFCVYALGSGNMGRTVPVKLFDAVAHGRPVIGTTGTLMADFIERNHWGCIVDQGDSAGLAAALRRTRARVQDPTHPLQLRPAPTWEEQGQVLCKAYATLLAR
ncbi:MAG TPA: glycosyltransferase [Polyangiales bacterium]